MPPRPDADVDPLAADRRTMVIAAVAMVALIGVGVASAALFTGSACGDLVVGDAPPAVAGTDVRQIVDEAYAGLDAAVRDAVIDGISELAGRLGPVTGIATAGQAERLTELTTGPAALGPTTTILSQDGSSVRANGTIDASGRLVGSGDTLYATALVNELTGQVDALQPLDVSLTTAGPCLDAATVNVPFAFHLDAGDGQLLVFRVEEDGDEPELELRDRTGAVWRAPVEVAVAPPGLLAERLSALLGEELVVSGRRVLAGEDAAAAMAVGRVDGARRWTVHPDALAVGDEPLWVEVAAVRTDVVLLALRQGDDDSAQSRLAGVDPQTGEIRWVDDDAAAHLRVLSTADGDALDVTRSDDRSQLYHLDMATGERTAAARLNATVVGGADGPGGDGAVLALGDAGVALVGDGAASTQGMGVAAVDVASNGDRTVVLLSDGQAAVVVTFGVT